MYPSRGQGSRSLGYRVGGKLKCHLAKCSLLEITYVFASGHHSAVCTLNDHCWVTLMRCRTYRDSLWGYRIPGTLHSSQTRSEVCEVLAFWLWLTDKSLTRMHRCRTFSRRDGKAASEGHGRSWQSRIHGQFSSHPSCPWQLIVSKGIRPSKYSVPRRKRPPFGRRLQSCWEGLSHQV